ncbi:phosphatidylinositol-specific phospholipase C domain-containing protein [Streptomyces sp. IBSNAI002]|uniref:phosphatidylinositol-specific phospholipase C domain-containing protein n=1 Tax=Streptomyces sp. IBSNAI002 TaxID=3457500 RepID=UPI003FCF0C52
MERRDFLKTTGLLTTAAGAALALPTGIARAGTPQPSSDIVLGRWMSRVADDVSLCNITIPGTHDSGATAGGLWWQCQEWDIRRQLDNGIRYLDIRADHHDLRICHGNVTMPDTFTDVLRHCDQFLARNESETILIRVKREGAGNGISGQDFVSAFDRIAGPLKKQGRLIQPAVIPTLREARGKVVVISNAGGLPGIPWAGGDCGTFENGHMVVQDHYKAPTAPRSWKKFTQHVEPFLVRAHNVPIKGKLYVNHLSATGATSGAATPYTIAKDDAFSRGVNHLTKDRIHGWTGPALGIVAMDYANLPDGQGAWLIHDLIRRNH